MSAQPNDFTMEAHFWFVSWRNDRSTDIRITDIYGTDKGSDIADDGSSSEIQHTQPVCREEVGGIDAKSLRQASGSLISSGLRG
jgi:hypothetical protein